VLRVARTLASRAGIQPSKDCIGADADLGIVVEAAPEEPALVHRRRRLEPLGSGLALAPGRIPQPLDQAPVALGGSLARPGRDHELLDAPNKLQVTAGDLVGGGR